MLHIQKPCRVTTQEVRFSIDAYRGLYIPVLLSVHPEKGAATYDIDLDYFQEFTYPDSNDNGVTHRKMLGPCFVTGPTTLTKDDWITSTAFKLRANRLSDGKKTISGCTYSQVGRDHFGGLWTGINHVKVVMTPYRATATAWVFRGDGIVWGPRDYDYTMFKWTASIVDDATYEIIETRIYVDKNGDEQPPIISKSRSPIKGLSYAYSDYDIDDVTLSIRKQLTAPERDHSDETKYFACKDAISHLDAVGINVYELLQPLQQGWRSIPKSYKRMLTDLKKFVESGGTDVKSFSNSYLSKKYGADNDIRDLRSLSGLKTLGTYLSSQTLHQHGAFNGLKATVHCSPFQEAINWTDVLGITPNASNLWATVPFSFAVDWFLKGGNNLREIELAAMWGNDCYHIHGVCYSTKIEYQCAVILPGFRFSNDISFSLYERWAERCAPDFVYEVPDYFSGLEDHIIEFGSLIVTNL